MPARNNKTTEAVVKSGLSCPFTKSVFGNGKVVICRLRLMLLGLIRAEKKQKSIHVFGTNFGSKSRQRDNVFLSQLSNFPSI
jgi:hypothetical protein